MFQFFTTKKDVYSESKANMGINNFTWDPCISKAAPKIIRVGHPWYVRFVHLLLPHDVTVISKGSKGALEGGLRPLILQKAS